MLNQKGEQLLKIAKNSIKLAFDDKDFDLIKTKDKELNEKRGAFVTLYYKKELRGCIGFIESKLPLWQSVAEAARLSAFDDPRFPPLQRNELDNVKFEISVLAKPQQIKGKPDDIIGQIEIGKDGLIIKSSGFSGLLLPQVAVENEWSAEEFLEQTCLKAGISPKSWKEKGCRIYKFQAQIFSQKKSA